MVDALSVVNTLLIVFCVILVTFAGYKLAKKLEKPAELAGNVTGQLGALGYDPTGQVRAFNSENFMYMEHPPVFFNKKGERLSEQYREERHGDLTDTFQPMATTFPEFAESQRDLAKEMSSRDDPLASQKMYDSRLMTAEDYDDGTRVDYTFTLPPPTSYSTDDSDSFKSTISED